MNKKSVIIIILFIILLLLGMNIFDFYNQEKIINVGSAEFTMPEGFEEGPMNEFGAKSITNGTNTIYLFENNDSDINKHIESYKAMIKDKNETMYITNFTFDGVLIYKTDNIDNPATDHYWFVKNGKTYDIYKWDRNENMDSMVIDLMKSMK